MKTSDWILEGFDSKADWEKAKGIKPEKKREKTFKVRSCPKCKIDEVGVLLGGVEGKGSKGWRCGKCRWEGHDVEEKEFSEEEFMKYLDEKGEGVA